MDRNGFGPIGLFEGFGIMSRKKLNPKEGVGALLSLLIMCGFLAFCSYIHNYQPTESGYTSAHTDNSEDGYNAGYRAGRVAGIQGDAVPTADALDTMSRMAIAGETASNPDLWKMDWKSGYQDGYKSVTKKAW